MTAGAGRTCRPASPAGEEEEEEEEQHMTDGECLAVVTEAGGSAAII